MATGRPSACFLPVKSLLQNETPVDGLDVCVSCEATSGKNSIIGAQKIAGLWRIYPATREARRRLIIEGISIGQQTVEILDENPFIVSRDGDKPVTKLIIGNVPLSLSNNEIEDMLKHLNVILRSSLKEENYRDKDGGLTRFKTGRRFIYIELPTVSLHKVAKIDKFTAFLHYKEQDKIGKNQGSEKGRPELDKDTTETQEEEASDIEAQERECVTEEEGQKNQNKGDEATNQNNTQSNTTPLETYSTSTTLERARAHNLPTQVNVDSLVRAVGIKAQLVLRRRFPP
ncbi:hypothetical protein ElyMa_004186400 [Elysia marginata]|uniref:RRM domain-containing protein n=1 Tax=Elysia marginata TaxID=1093978 RepID=A0AAV4GKG9_9GAST|nr:hypothetical protein ElyMa_004186400 [Elysia marginata]